MLVANVNEDLGCRVRGTLAGPVMIRSRLGVDGPVYVATSSCDDEGLGSSSISERVCASEAPRHGRCALMWPN